MTKSDKNIVAKGEIARFEQFLLLSLRFQKAVCYRGASESVYMRERVKPSATDASNCGCKWEIFNYHKKMP